jgi:hypothetical protein
MTHNPVIPGRLLQDGKLVAEVATIRWTLADGKQVPWTGRLTLADKAKPVGSGRLTLQQRDGTSGPILLMATAWPGAPAPFCFAEPPPKCKPPGVGQVTLPESPD